MKKTVWIILGSVVLFAFILVSSIVWYNFFEKQELKIANLNISFTEASIPIRTEEVAPIDDSNISMIPAYKFSVGNEGNAKGKYRVLIKEAPINKVNDGCTGNNQLDRSQLRYQLSINGKVVKTAMLSDLTDDILDMRIIDVKEINQYQLRVWVPKSKENTEWLNKHYHYILSVEPMLIKGE